CATPLYLYVSHFPFLHYVIAFFLHARHPRQHVPSFPTRRSSDLEEAGTVDAPIGRHPTERKRMAVTERGSRPAVTHWEVIARYRSEEHTSELQSRFDLVCRLLLEKKKLQLLYLSYHRAHT